MLIALTYKTDGFIKIGDFDINVAIKLYNVANEMKNDNKIFKNHLVSKNSQINAINDVTKEAGLVLTFLFDYMGFWSRKINGNVSGISIKELDEALSAIHNFLTIFSQQ